MTANKIFLVLFLFSFSLFLPKASDAADKKAPTPLYDAVLFQDLTKVRELIAKGADVNQMQNGRPILGWAAQNGNVEIVKALIDGKVDVNKADQGAVGHTPLMRAIDTQQFAIVQALLDAKANPNAKAPDGESCLNMAVESKKPEIIRALIKAGADANYVDSEGNSAALIAAQDGSLEIIKILGEAKANMDASNAAYTPLSYAIEQGNVPLVKALLEAGASPNAKTQSGKAPLHSAIDNKEILQILLEAKADPNIEDGSGETPLTTAVRYPNVEAVRALVAAKADLNKRDQYGNTPLEIAKQNYQTEIESVLTESITDKPAALDLGTGKPVQQMPANFGGSKCTIVDAAKRQMEVHGLLQAQVDAGKMSSEIFRTFGEDTKEFGDLLTTDPDKACALLDRLRLKYGV